MDLKKLFEPKAIAVIGASRDKKKVGGSIVANLRDGRFTGRVYPVNPKSKTVQGLASFASVEDIQGAIDLAVIAVPAPIVAAVLASCGKKKIPFVIIVTAGFGETGTEGKAEERRLASIAKKYHITIVGPNCLGIIATGSRLNASFAGRMPHSGGISCISQSGALLVSLMDWSQMRSLGMRDLISIGNQAGLSEIEVLDYLAHDSATTVVGMYIEQISNGPAFMAAVARCTRKKPVIILKAGVSEAGTKAVSSHTGSLAGSARVMSAMIEQSGAIQAYDVEDFFKLLQLFSYGHANHSLSTAIVTNAGGPGIIATDLLSSTNLHVSSFSERTLGRLKRALPSNASVHNPVDLVGDADLDRFKKVFRILEDDECGIIFVIVTPQRMTPVMDIARSVASFQKRSKKQIIACFIGGTMVAKANAYLTEQGVMNFKYPQDALRILAASKGNAGTFKKNQSRAVSHADGDMHMMPYARLQRLLKKKFPILSGRIITNAKALPKNGYPVAIKVLSSKAIHKARSQAIALHVPSRERAATVVNQFIKKFKGKGFEGILVQPMVDEGKEFIMGFTRDSVAGLTLLFGIGGTLTEELGDTILHIGPIKNAKEIGVMTRKLRHAEVLQGVDMKFITGLVKKLSDFATSHTDIQSLDFNPVRVYAKGGVIVDARIVIKK